VSPRTSQRYNPHMTRLLGPLFAAWLAIAALGIAGAAPVLADDPGTPTSQAGTTSDYDIGAEPLLPYVAALFVVSAGLSVVGFVALWAQRPRPPRHRVIPPDEPPAS